MSSLHDSTSVSRIWFGEAPLSRWSAEEIRRPLLRYPVMPATVMAGIHWQALRLWWKGVPVVRRLTGDGVGERAAYAVETAGRSDSMMER